MEEKKAATEVLIEEMSVQRAGAGKPPCALLCHDAKIDRVHDNLAVGSTSVERIIARAHA